MKRALFSSAVALLAVVSVNLTPAQAQPAHVFVAAQGSDSNPCTLAQPCLTFQHAHDTVAAGGVIDVLSPADYGVVTITKAISIQGHGFAGLAVTSGNGITINAGASDKVSLRGLLIDGVGSGSNGIAFSTGVSLDVQECLIRNFTANGINFIAGATSALFVADTHVAANGADGIRVADYGLNGAPSGTLDRVIAVGNGGNGLEFFLPGTGAVQFDVGILGETVPPVAQGVIDDGSPSAALHPKVAVQAGDIILAKPHIGCFQATELETILRARGIDTVLIGGIATNFCCDTTAREAHAREFKVLFLSDGTATNDLRDTAGGTISADQVQRLTLATLALAFAEVLSVAQACEKLPATRTRATA
jgi:ureidoacrylate peracid hydrolase